MSEKHAHLDRRTVLKKGAAATGVVASGLAVTGQAAAAETCEMVIEGQGEFDIHLIAEGLEWENTPVDMEVRNYDAVSGQLVTMEGSVSSERDGSGDDYFAGTLINWDDDAYKNGLADDGVTVTICGEERDVDSW